MSFLRRRLAHKYLTICFLIASTALLYVIIFGTVFKNQEILRPRWAQNPSKNDTAFVVDTASCRLPRTTLWPDFYAKESDWREHRVPFCDQYVKFATLNDDDMKLELKDSMTPDSCQLFEITRDGESDNDYKLVNNRTFNSSKMSVADMELMMIQCNNSTNFEATIPLKNSVEEKIKYWRDKSEKPYNVLIIGIDSTSRLHLIRGLPKTMALLNELDFLSFEGSHSIEPSTLPNVIPMLMGMTEAQVRETCAEDWDTPFDGCPFIWKEFSNQKYVTVYNEDGSGTFNWGGQSGFKNNPTDYYLHLMLRTLTKTRENNGSDFRAEQCISTEGVPAYMIRYLRRFLQKHSETPFFIFNYHNNPFHDSEFAIPSYDSDFSEFISFVKSQPDLLENTLIVVMTDHGDRYNFFSYDSMESYIERALTGLFLRIPNRLEKEFPEFHRNALENTHRLVTCFDINHTLRHILALSGFTSKFQPHLKDRSSLFYPVLENRTCQSVNIPKEFCVCNTSMEIKSPSNPFFVNQLIDFSVNHINSLVSSSKYSDACEEWERTDKSLISANIVEESGEFMTVLLKILLDPCTTTEDDEHCGEFSAMIKVNTTSKERRMEVEGKMSRINKYGDQSSCVGFDTDDDKRMKEFCFCKKKKKKDESLEAE